MTWRGFFLIGSANSQWAHSAAVTTALPTSCRLTLHRISYWSATNMRNRRISNIINSLAIQSSLYDSLLVNLTVTEKPSVFLSRKARKTAGKYKRPAGSFELAGRPVDCLGLTKRWSLYVASHGNSRAPDRPASGGINPYSPIVCGL